MIWIDVGSRIEQQCHRRVGVYPDSYDCTGKRVELQGFAGKGRVDALTRLLLAWAPRFSSLEAIVKGGKICS